MVIILKVPKLIITLLLFEIAAKTYASVNPYNIYSLIKFLTVNKDCFDNDVVNVNEKFKIVLSFFSTDNKIGQDLTLPLREEKLASLRSFNPKYETKIISHGYKGHDQLPAVKELKKLFLRSKKPVNVIVVNWNEGAEKLLYNQAAYNTKYTAQKLAEALNALKTRWPQNWKSVHLIGHSLGAHVVGQTGQFLKTINKDIQIDRITGLDPAEPCFEKLAKNKNSPRSLSKADAKFVDVIHSDSVTIPNGALGLLRPCGHADFYLNGGNNQPECDFEEPRALNLANLGYHIALQKGLCNHFRAFDVFIESVKYKADPDCDFFGEAQTLEPDDDELTEPRVKTCSKSNNCPQMGIKADKFSYNPGVQNTFYVSTEDRKSKCKKYFSNQITGYYSNIYKPGNFLELAQSYSSQIFNKIG